MHIQRIIKDWFTGPDGETQDPARFLWFVGVITFLVFSGIEVYRHDKFDLVQFALAYSGLLAAGAAGVKIKESTEPSPKPPAPPQPQPIPTSAPLPKPVTQVNVTVRQDDDDLPRPPKG